MLPKDEPDTPAERQAPIPELLEDYKTQHVRLLVQARELERLRQQVRGSAEREAAAIVTAARRDVRKVLLDARRELLVLVAQLQAVGCATQQGDAGKFVLGEATATSTISPAVEAPDALAPPQEIASDARRDVREVLLEAQSELIALSDQARELRARIAKQHDAARESLPADLELAPEPVPPADPPGPAAEPPGYVETVHSQYASLSSPPRVWVVIAAAVAFAAFGLLALLLSGNRQPPAAASADRPQATSQPAKPPAAAASAPGVAASAPDASPLALAIEVRRPVWLRTTVDGRADVGRLFRAGQTTKVTANRDVVLRAGDAGAVFVSMNGGPARALGGDGQVATRRFGAPPPPVRTDAADVAPAQPRPAIVQTAERSPELRAPAAEAPRPDIGTTGSAEAPQAPAERLAVPGSAAATDAEREILRVTRRWFEAYFGGDPAGMAEVTTEDFSLTDQRGQRLPTTMPDVDRSMQQVRIEVAGDGAVLSARLTERAVIDGQVRQYVSLVSGVWIRRDGRWRLMGMRFVDPANIGFMPR